MHFSVNSIKVHEDLGLLNVTVLRQGGSTGPLMVDFATVEGTAFAGEDYTSTSGTLSFSDGETSKTLQVPILADAPNDPDETFTTGELVTAVRLESRSRSIRLHECELARSVSAIVSSAIWSQLHTNFGLLRRSHCFCLDHLHHPTNTLSDNPAEDTRMICSLLLLFSHECQLSVQERVLSGLMDEPS